MNKLTVKNQSKQLKTLFFKTNIVNYLRIPALEQPTLLNAKSCMS